MTDAGALVDEIIGTRGVRHVVTSTTEMHVPAGTPSASVFSGAAGIGLAMAELAVRCERPEWSPIARAWSEVAARSDDRNAFFPPDFFGPGRRPSEASFHHGPVGAQVAIATCAALQRDPAGLVRAVGRISRLANDTDGTAHGSASSAVLDDASLVSGLCGLLATIRDAADPEATSFEGTASEPSTCAGADQGVRRTQDVIVSLIAERLDRLDVWIATQPISDMALPNLGAAHGWTGVLDAALRASRALGVDASDWLLARATELATFMEIRRGEALWPVAAGHPAARCGGWRNGAAGHVSFWCRLHEWSGDAHHLDIAVATAATMSAETSAVPNLSCGSAGKVLAALNLFRTTREHCWIDSALASLDEAAQLRGERTPPMIQLDGVPLSVYQGDLGVAIAAAALLDPERPIRSFP